METIWEVKMDLTEASVVRAYVDDLKALLNKGPTIEQKSFLRTELRPLTEALLGCDDCSTVLITLDGAPSSPCLAVPSCAV